MKHPKNLRTIGMLLSLFLLMLPQPADAYIEPGTGSYLLQIILAALVGGIFAIKRFYWNIKDFFARHLSKADKKNKDIN